jgi:23S rRNA (pseudouridine1915-N3)-methyltransferase
MISIDIFVGGKSKRDWAVEGINHYIKILKKYSQVSIKTYDEELGLTSESGQLLKRVQDTPFVILDESGKKLDSEGFAKFFKTISEKSGKIAFFIGGHRGFSKEVIDAAHNVISFSPMTFSHRLTLVILLEQIYRAFDLLSGQKYRR